MVESIWTTGHLPISGGDLLWRSYGDGSKPTVLLVHGGLRGRGTSSKPYELLSPLGRDRRLVTWDQLGCGESVNALAPESLGIGHYAGEVENIRRALAPGPIHLFAASIGTAFAIEWLATYEPADVRSIVLLAPIIDGQRAQASLQAAQGSSGADFQRTFITRGATPLGAGGPPDPALNRTLTAQLGAWNRTSELNSLPVPVLFVRGTFDYITDADMRAYATQCPGSKTETITGAAHLAFIDDPAETCRVVRPFLDATDYQKN